MSKQEVIDDGSLFILRLPVPGGWIYNSFDKSNQILGSCFVPSQGEKVNSLKNLNREMLEALKETQESCNCSDGCCHRENPKALAAIAKAEGHL